MEIVGCSGCSFWGLNAWEASIEIEGRRAVAAGWTAEQAVDKLRAFVIQEFDAAAQVALVAATASDSIWQSLSASSWQQGVKK